MTHESHRKLMVFRPIGLLLLAAALLLTAYNIWDDSRAAVSSQHVLSELNNVTPVQPIPKIFESDGAGETEGTDIQETADVSETPDPNQEMPNVSIEGNAYIGSLYFPSLELTLPVMSDWDYDKLKISPCRYAGTAYQSGFVIAGHNYRKHFGPLNHIQTEDTVIFTDVDGNTYFYQVTEIQVLEATAIEDMLSDDWDLSLFTCTLGGQTRLTVRCEQIEAE